MVGHRPAGQRGEIRQFAQRDVHPEGAGAAAPFGDAPQEIRRQRGRIDQIAIEQLRIEVGDDCAAANRLALARHDPDAAAVLDQHLAHRGIGPDLDAGRPGGARHGLGDGAHAADGMTPDALLAVDLAEGVMQQHIGRAGLIRAGEIADDAVEAVDCFDRVAFEPAIEIIAGRHGEEVEQFAPMLDVEPFQPACQRAALSSSGKAASQPPPGRLGGACSTTSRSTSPAVQLLGIGIEPVGVATREFRDLVMRLAGADLEVAAILQRQEIRQPALDDAQPMGGQFEIGDDLGIEQRDRVGRDRIAEARMEFLGHRRPADDTARLEHGDTEPGLGQIGGTDQPVMTASDDDDVAHDGSSKLHS